MRVERPTPDERRDLGDRPRSRELDRILPTIEEPPALDQRDARLEYRTTVTECVRRDRGGIPSILGTPSRALDVLAGIEPRASAAAFGRRAYEAATHVGVERLALDAESARRFCGTEPRRSRHEI